MEPELLDMCKNCAWKVINYPMEIISEKLPILICKGREIEVCKFKRMLLFFEYLGEHPEEIEKYFDKH